MLTIWMDIEGYESLYQVSDKGEVRSYDRKVNARNGNTAIRKGRLLAQVTKSNGYKAVSLTRDVNDKVQALVHRLVADAFIVNSEDKTQVNHKDGDKTNNCVTNLEWVTPKENTDHAFRTGLRKLARNKSLNNKPLTSKSGYRGVYRYKKTNKWTVEFRKKGVKYFLGIFECKHDAASMYNFWAIDLIGDSAKLNVIKEGVND